MSIQRKVAQFVRRHQLLSLGDRVLVAVSGGPDSVALLHLLNSFGDEQRLSLEVAHLQHGIRGAEAREDARFVGELAKELELPFHLREVDLPRRKSEAGKGNLEALARKERYEFLATVARDRGIEKVATGHTQDDQAETLLLWLLRGSGRKGLGGMAPIQPLNAAAGAASKDLMLIRPLLDVSKGEILGFLKERHFSYRVDRSNQDLTLLRNWIRLQLIPQLKERVDARLPSRLSQQAEIFRDEERFLERLVKAKLDDIREGKALKRDLLVKHERGLQRRLLRMWVEEARGHLRGIDFGHTEDALRLIAEGPAQGRLSIPGGWELVKEYGTLRLERRARYRSRLCYSYDFEIGKELDIPEAGATLRSARVLAPLRQLPDNLLETIFDAAALPERLTVRNFREGDRFQPLGMAGRKKVKDFFIDKKVPLTVRATLPLLVEGQEVLWIPGYGRSEAGKIGPQTKEMLNLRLEPWPS